jgi:hypothetical protein
MNATNNYLFKYITLLNSILLENQGITMYQHAIVSHPGSKEQNRSLYTCAQDVQITCIATI